MMGPPGARGQLWGGKTSATGCDEYVGWGRVGWVTRAGGGGSLGLPVQRETRGGGQKIRRGSCSS